MPHSFVKAKVQSKVQELLKKYEPHGSSKHVGKTKYFEPQYDVNKIFHRKTLLSKRGESVKNIRGCPSLSSFPCVKSQKKVEILRENSKKSLSPVAFSENRLLKHSNKSIMASYDRLMNSYSVIPHSKPFVFTKERKKVLRIRKTIESITKDPELKLNS